jgi:hypothetical protein
MIAHAFFLMPSPVVAVRLFERLLEPVNFFDCDLSGNSCQELNAIDLSGL